jgi:hypothetical protein
MRSEVEYKLGEILLKPTQPGFKQFSITARIAQGLSRTESFAVEVLPSSWSRVLVLGDGMRDPEIVGTLKVLPGAQVINPLMQELNDRALALRDAVVLGTSVFSDPQALAAAAPAIARAKVLMVQTPALENLPVDLSQALARMGLQMRGRYATVLGPNPPGFSKFPVNAVAGAGLTAPYKAVQLAGTLTTESSNPMLLNVAASGSCRSVLQGVYQSVPNLPGYELPLVAKCEQGGRRFVISGMEWADLVPQTTMDQKIVSRWLEEVLK